MQNNRNMLVSALFLTVLSLVAVVTATYSWMGVSRIPFVSDVSLSVITENSLLIAPDNEGQPGEWNDYLDASAFLSDLVPLKPVTYTPEAFCKIVYDETGRTNGVEPLAEGNINVRYPDADRTSAASKAAEAEGFMVVMPLWMKAEGAAGGEVYLSDPVETADGQMGGGTYAVGTPIWEDGSVSHRNGGYGAESTLRFGFACTPCDQQGNPTGDMEFIIYEPNMDRNADATTDYRVTQSVNGGPLIDDDHLILQTASTWNETNPVLQDVVIYSVGQFVQNRPLFTLPRGGMMKVDVCIWMEGQDSDCIARNVADAVSITANLQFGVKADEIISDIGRGEIPNQ